MQAISKKAKKLYWRELVAMTAEPGWDANPAICQRVEAINKITSSEDLSESRPLGNIDYYRFTPGNFLYLKFLGYQIREIQEACGVSKTTFGKFLADFELTRDFYSNTRINQMKFTKSDMTIPQWDGKFREVADSKNDDDPG